MTKDKFNKYQEIRESGKTNMLELSNVVSLSNGILTKEDCLDIIRNYHEYKKQYDI